MVVNGRFLQFSKIMVIIIVGAATFLTGASLFGMISAADFTFLPDTINGYLRFASVVFAAYSGNSAIEKWLQSQNNQQLHEEKQSPVIEEDEGDAESRRLQHDSD